MISDEVRQAGLTAINVAAAMLVEDAHDALVSASMVTGGRGPALAAKLSRLGTDLTSLADAAAVFAQQGAAASPEKA